MKRRILICGAIILVVITGALLAGCSEQTKSAESQEPERIEVEDQEMTINIRNWGEDGKTKGEYEERTGIYSGETIDGVPDGVGTFTSANPEGKKWIYEGEFKNAVFDGIGKRYYPDEDDYGVLEGHFTDGLFTPTKVEFIKCLGTGSDMTYTLLETTETVISENENLFPAMDEESIAKAIEITDESTSIKELKKNLLKNGEKLFSKTGLIVNEIFESGDLGYDFTQIFAFDSNYTDCYAIYYIGTVDIYEGDRINFRGLPIANTSYKNTEGGSTNNTLFLGSIVEKK